MERHGPRNHKPQDIPTDGFSSWLSGTRRAQRTDEGASVPCGDCRGCCTSSYFIHIRPDETGTLARIPKKLLFPAPGLPKGNVLLGYDENGHCPMLVDNTCSIYAHRPRTCRDYDCRIFPATGLQVDDDKTSISLQAGRWKFDLSTTRDHECFSAVRAAAKFLKEHACDFPAGFVPGNPTQLAIVAIKVYGLFLGSTRKPGIDRRAATRGETVEAIVAAYERFGTEDQG